jgi:hypothetical protein
LEEGIVARLQGGKMLGLIPESVFRNIITVRLISIYMRKLAETILNGLDESLA